MNQSDSNVGVAFTPALVHLWPINPNGSCSCGAVRCNAPGKHPRHGMGPLPGGGVGVLTGARPLGSGIFVVDCDVKPGIDGRVAFEDLCRANGMATVPDTLIVVTGGHGLHFYFRHPGFPICNSQSKLAKGVDVKGDGTSFVVAPGSPHVSGHPYRILHPDPVANGERVALWSDIADAPGWLLDWPGLRKGVLPEPPGGGGGGTAVPRELQCDPTSEEGQRRIMAFRSECRGETGDYAAAISGSGGHLALFRVARRGILHWLLPEDTIVAIIAEDYNPRCIPPWDEREIRHKVDDAFLNKTNEIITGPIPATFGSTLVLELGGGEGMIPPRESNPDHVYSMRPGDVVADQKRRSMGVSEGVYTLKRHEVWRGVLRYDSFRECIVASDPPIPLECEVPGENLTNNDITAIRIWFEVSANANVSKDIIGGVIEAAAKESAFHPVRDYLHRLPAGDPRIFVGLARRFFGVPDVGGLDDEMLKRFLVGAARRILKPGIQMDTMLILHGDQGAGKSTWIKAIFGDDFTAEQMPDLSKAADASHSIATTWAQEISELDALLKADLTTVKAFLSRKEDKFRQPYARSFTNKKRQAVMIGTTNTTGILRDETGERRFWIVEIPAGHQIDIGAVIAIRDHVWAAAMALARDDAFEHFFREGDVWDLMLKERQTAHHCDSKIDGWVEAVRVYLQGKATVRTEDVYRDVIAKGEAAYLDKFDKRKQMRLGGVLRALGCKKWQGGVYRVPDELAREPERVFGSVAAAAPSLVLVKGGKP